MQWMYQSARWLVRSGGREAALRRIEAGGFGLCQACGKPIAPERLEALPWATDCIDCDAKKRR